MTSNTVRPRILISSGEPAGIGPDLIIKLLQQETDMSHVTVMIDPDLLQQRADLLGLSIHQSVADETGNVLVASQENSLQLMPVKLRKPVKPGILDVENADYVLEMLDTGCDACLQGHFDALVTGPLQKSVINDAGIAFSGHTEYLAKACGDVFPVMLLACPELKVALVTTHLPLREVPDAITRELLQRVLSVVIHDMRHRFRIPEPKLIVCGLNPHAGEDGHLGSEEQTVIEPVIRELQSEGAHIRGPLPADTAFRDELRQSTDVFIAMYHDQGLPVLKTLGFGDAVNITLGLPIIRTSVDHGTALQLAGTGKADAESLIAAINMAAALVQETAFSPSPVTELIDAC